MRTEPQPYEVRELVAHIFERLGVDVSDPSHIDETILIDDGKYAARSYRADEYLAMWLVEIGVVQFYDSDGAMLYTVNLLEELEPHRIRLAA